MERSFEFSGERHLAESSFQGAVKMLRALKIILWHCGQRPMPGVRRGHFPDVETLVRSRDAAGLMGQGIVV
jgi:hypothetical protein